jgi:hypothetical protein
MDSVSALLCRSGLAINDHESLALLGYGPGGAVLGTLGVAVGVALVAAPFVRAMYRRRVIRLMRFAQIDERTPEAATSSDSVHSSHPLRQRTRWPDFGVESNGVAAAACRQHRIVQGTVLALVVFMLSALMVARILGRTWADAGAMFVIAGLVAGGPLLVNVRPYGSRGTTLLTLSMFTSGFLGAEMLFPSQGSDRVDVFATMSVAILALFVGLIHRTLRPLVLPLAIIVCALLCAAFTPIVVGTFVADCESAVGKLQDVNLMMTASLVGAPLLGLAVMVAFRVLDQLARWQRRGVVNEISVVVAFAMLLIAFLLTWGLLEERGIQPSLEMLLVSALWAATPCVAYFKATALPVRATQPGHALLVLRVFDKTGRAQQLLDRLQAQWRLIGPVWQIGGPDLASLNVSLFESTMFLAGRLHELFLSGAVSTGDLEHRLRRLPGRDGRWGVDEVFCFNTAWRPTVDHLMTMSDAILIDVRGVTADRTGIRDELMLLGRSDRLARTLAIGDKSTDWTYVNNIVHASAGDGAHLVTRATETSGGEVDYFAELTEMATRSGRITGCWSGHRRTLPDELSGP